jgi:uncharacterized membrane protein HdeD (DUF308 family)
MNTHHWVDTFHDPLAFAHKAGTWLIVTAIAFMLLGTMAILAPLAAGLAVSVLVGWLLIASGILHGINAYRTDSIARAAGQVFVGLLYTVAGLYFLAHPLYVLGALTVSLACVLCVEALMDVVAWFGSRGEEGAGWLLVNAAITIVLSVLIFLHWPSISVWAIGTLLGLNLITSGVSRLMMGAAVRRIAQRLS